MSIEGISNKAELEAFVRDLLRNVGVNDIRGLNGQLSERARSRGGGPISVTIPEGATASAATEVEHGLGEIPQNVHLTALKSAGGTPISFRLTSYDKTKFAFIANVPTAAGAGGFALEVLWDVEAGI